MIAPILLLVVLTACSSPTPPPSQPTATLPGVLTPYWTATFEPTRPAPALPTIIPVTPLPTPTPFTYIITEKDTMLGIAIRYGISLKDLQAANPGMDPNFLTVGKPMVIPLNGMTPAGAATATPIPLQAQPPECYPTAEGGAWCLLVVTNDQSMALEDLSGWIAIYSQEGQMITSQGAIAPLNLVLPGETMPLAAYFPPPLPAGWSARGGLLASLPIADLEQRYLSASIKNQKVEIGITGKQAAITGEISFPEGSRPARLIWVATVAFGPQGEVAGFRKWEAPQACVGAASSITQTATPTWASKTEQPTSTSTLCGPLPFKLSVYSLGPAIQRVELFVEARP